MAGNFPADPVTNGLGSSGAGVVGQTLYSQLTSEAEEKLAAAFVNVAMAVHKTL